MLLSFTSFFINLTNSLFMLCLFSLVLEFLLSYKFLGFIILINLLLIFLQQIMKHQTILNFSKHLKHFIFYLNGTVFLFFEVLSIFLFLELLRYFFCNSNMVEIVVFLIFYLSLTRFINVISITQIFNQFLNENINYLITHLFMNSINFGLFKYFLHNFILFQI